MLFFRFVAVLFLMCRFGEAQGQAASGTTWAMVEKNGSGNVTVLYLEEAGFAYTDAEGQLTGVEIDILRQFFNYVQKSKKVTLNVEFVRHDDFTKLYRTVKSSTGGVFGLANVTITPERKKEIAFSPAYLTNIAVLISNSAAPSLTNMADLSTTFRGFTGIVYKGTQHENRMRQLRTRWYNELTLADVNSDTELIERVSKEKNAFGYSDVGIYWLALQAGKPIKRHAIADESNEEFGFILPLNSDWEPMLKEFFTLGAGGYRGNPAYGRLLRKHLGDEVTKMMEMTVKKAQSNK